MPNVAIFIPAEAIPVEEHLTALTGRCTDLCIGMLRAVAAHVHVIYVPVRHGDGHPVFAQIDDRLGPCRLPPVMQRFMAALDDAIASNTGLSVRIRCFGYAPSSIHARG